MVYIKYNLSAQNISGSVKSISIVLCVEIYISIIVTNGNYSIYLVCIDCFNCN